MRAVEKSGLKDNIELLELEMENDAGVAAEAEKSLKLVQKEPTGCSC